MRGARQRLRDGVDLLTSDDRLREAKPAGATSRCVHLRQVRIERAAGAHEHRT